MAKRIVVNQHYDNASVITPDKFTNKGEIVISNEFGDEALFIINTLGEVIKIGKGGGSGSGSTPSGDYITPSQLANYLKVNAYTTSGDTVRIASMEVAKIIDSADSRYDTLKEIADWIMSDTTGAAKMANDIADLQEQIKHVGSSDHVFLSRREYDELIANGYANVSGEVITYYDDVYYCIYEDDGSVTPPTPSGETLVYILSGDTIIFPTLTESGGMIEINAEVIDGFINLDSAYTPSGDDDKDVVIEDGNMVISQDDIQTIGNEDFVNLDNYNIQPIE